MNDPRIAIITDSGPDLDREYCDEHDIRVVPLRINYSDGSSFQSGVDITADEVVARFEEEIPRTSLPSPEQIKNALEQAREDGYQRAVIVTIASALSATNQTAQMIADQMTDVIPTLVVDTRSIGLVAGMVVERAVDYIERGVPFEELDARLQVVVAQTDIYFGVRSLDNLYRGGRINKHIYRIGNALNIKPVLTCNEEGYYTIAKKARGWDRCLDTIVKLVADNAAQYESVRIGLCCSTATKALYKPLEQRLREAIPHVAQMFTRDIKADLVVHTGPNIVGVGVQNAAV